MNELSDTGDGATSGSGGSRSGQKLGATWSACWCRLSPPSANDLISARDLAEERGCLGGVGDKPVGHLFAVILVVCESLAQKLLLPSRLCVEQRVQHSSEQQSGKREGQDRKAETRDDKASVQWMSDDAVHPVALEGALLDWFHPGREVASEVLGAEKSHAQASGTQGEAREEGGGFDEVCEGRAKDDEEDQAKLQPDIELPPLSHLPFHGVAHHSVDDVRSVGATILALLQGYSAPAKRHSRGGNGASLGDLGMLCGWALAQTRELQRAEA
mmetsp:Transcript_13762/g.34605  ORF Transcript_13762/g.34605 Transcript_13762/m.34605 type:complete len:272 (-) Transcript_13762:82-897(-)